ncbi:TonB-dependent receptor [Sutterella sp.]|uniref:TonB-dependent receptor domain-containing protein n=1 Tax=Sutterella sp. TaxID=1981025 RepID=UPI0026DFBCDA|nr:TonB-dependent receptor [Sutterella sp.]MDO5531478.1 TonB-dependent receptor [Sutterella sp.]
MQQKKALVLLPLSLAVATAFAADDGYTTLDTTVVSATGYEQDTREAPASVTVITSKELMTKPITDIATAVSDVPGVDITSTKMGTSQIYIRGFDSNYTLLMVDGRRQNADGAMNSLNGFEAGGIFMPPPGAIDRIEVVRGPASTIYGSDGIGGAVNIIMKKHVDKFTGTLSIERTQFDDIDWGNRWGAGAYLGIPLVEDTASLMLRARYMNRHASNLRAPDGSYASHATGAGYSGNIGGRLTVSPNTNNDVYLDLDYTHFKGGTMSTSREGYQASRWFDKYAAVIGHEGRYDIGELSSYFQIQGLNMTRLKTGPAVNDVPAGYASSANQDRHSSFNDPIMESRHYVAATKLKTPLKFGDYGDAILQTGLDFDYATFKSFYNENAETYGKKLDHTQIAAFGEAEYFINEEWIATVGARLHWSDVFDWHVAPRAYLVWKPSEGFSVKGGVANGYRVPQIQQLTNGVYSFQSGRNPQHTYGNPDLKPEESWNYELSTTFHIAQAASVTASVFYTDFRNQLDKVYINYAGSGRNQTYDAMDINNGEVEAKGVELLVNTAKFYGFSGKLGWTYTHAEIKGGESDGLRPNAMPRHSITARIDWDHNDWNAYIKSVTKLDSRDEELQTGYTSVSKYKNYTTVDLGVNYTFMKQHHFAVALNNIFDEGLEFNADGDLLYRDWIDGRNLWLSYSYTF